MVKESTRIFRKILLLFGVGVFIFFLLSVDFKGFAQVVYSLGTPILYLLFVTLLNILVKAWRWKILTKKVAATSISAKFSFSSIIAGVAAGSFVPGRIELAKPFLLKSEYDVPLSKSLSSLVVERVLDLLSILLILFGSMYFIGSQTILDTRLSLLILLLLFICVFLLTFFPRLFYLITRWFVQKLPFSKPFQKRVLHFFYEMFNSFRVLRSKSDSLLFVSLSLLANILEVLRFYLLLVFLGVSGSFAIAAFVFTASLIIGIISSVPGGIGVIEFSAVAILAYLLPQANGTLLQSAILLERIISYYLLVLLGALILMFQYKISSNLKQVK